MAKKDDTTFFENKLLDFVTAKDPMLEMVQWVMDKFMEIEVAHKTGQKKGVTLKPEQDTGAATESAVLIQDLEQFIFRFRKYDREVTFRSSQRRRNAHLNGVSTRKIEKIAKRLGIETLSASEVSEINNGLDEMVDEFRSKKLEAEHPVIWCNTQRKKRFFEAITHSVKNHAMCKSFAHSVFFFMAASSTQV